MTDFVTVPTLTTYPGVVLSQNTETNEWVVDMVNDLINEVIDSMDPVPVIPVPSPPTLVNLAHRAAARALANADGYESLTIQIDDYKETARFRDTSEQGVGVYLTLSEKAEIRAALTDEVKPRRPRGVGSIDLAVPGVR